MSGIEIALGVASVVGTGLNIYGGLSAASAQAEAAKKNAALKNQQADELLYREAINEQNMQEAGEEIISRSNAKFSGFADGNIGATLKARQKLLDNISYARREADFKSKQLRAGAEMDLTLSSDLATAGMFKTAGTVLSSAGDYARDWGLYKAPSKTTPYRTGLNPTE